MKNGWYKIGHKDEAWKNYWTSNEELVYIENNVIIESKDEFTGEITEKNAEVTEKMKKNLFLLDFDGVGIA